MSILSFGLPVSFLLSSSNSVSSSIHCSISNIWRPLLRTEGSSTVYPKWTSHLRLRDLLHPESSTLPLHLPALNNWFGSVITHCSPLQGSQFHCWPPAPYNALILHPFFAWTLRQSTKAAASPRVQHFLEDDQSILIETSSCNLQFFQN